MNKLTLGLIFFLSLFLLITCYALQAGDTTPFELPAPRSDLPEQILYRKGYTVSYNKETMQPNWVAWHLTAEHADGEWQRPSGNAFHEDAEVPTPRASNYDYKGSGWSRGHLCPAGDNKWDKMAMYESFLLSNVCPQHARLNSGDWNDIEQKCRCWAKKYGDIYIVCGPIFYRQEHKTIGNNNMPVPEAFKASRAASFSRMSSAAARWNWRCPKSPEASCCPPPCLALFPQGIPRPFPRARI